MPLPAEYETWWEKEIRKLEERLEAVEIALKRANDKLWSHGEPAVEPEERAA